MSAGRRLGHLPAVTLYAVPGYREHVVAERGAQIRRAHRTAGLSMSAPSMLGAACEACDADQPGVGRLALGVPLADLAEFVEVEVVH